ncbi:MAG: divalent-cation tolerance protein CutA [Candidatus Kapabacteria bacterium]|nr:divalent-cation tolerance protein CutA [Candidatus Kapabacteria bacterium]
MDSASDFRIAYVTLNSIETATHICRILVSENLAASCTILPNAITFFRSEKIISEKNECLIMIKTMKNLVEKLISRVDELHYGEVTEIVTVKIQDAAPPYLEWMESALNENQL